MGKILSRFSFYFLIIFIIGLILLILLIYSIMYKSETVTEKQSKSPKMQSYCSDRATARGGNQSVLSFCFFGSATNDRLYFFGIAGNAKDLPNFYPNWTIRVYHRMKANDTIWPTMEALEKAFPHLDLCNVSSLPVFGNVEGSVPTTWRFIPMGDPLVRQFISRDLDSYIITREQAAVKEWLASNLTFHVMRDHIGHGDPILAGMWGAKRYHDPELMDNLLNKILEKAKKKGNDQHILLAIVWPEMKDKVMQHDAYYCNRFRKHGNMLPFPTKRVRNLFPGSAVTIIYPLASLSKCPIACRPKDHQDWEYC